METRNNIDQGRTKHIFPFPTLIGLTGLFWAAAEDVEEDDCRVRAGSFTLICGNISPGIRMDTMRPLNLLGPRRAMSLRRATRRIVSLEEPFACQLHFQGLKWEMEGECHILTSGTVTPLHCAPVGCLQKEQRVTFHSKEPAALLNNKAIGKKHFSPQEEHCAQHMVDRLHHLSSQGPINYYYRQRRQ